MSFVAIMFWVITHAPELIGLLKEVMQIVHSLPGQKGVALKANLVSAIEANDISAFKGHLTDCVGTAPELVH